MKINKYGLLTSLMVIFTFTTLSYTLWPISSPNRIVGMLIFVAMLIIFLNKLDRKKAILLLICFMMTVWTVLNATQLSRNLTDAIYWVITILMLYDLSDSTFRDKINRELYKSKPIIKLVILICNALLCVGFFDPRCYDTERWVDRYYIGYTNAAHTLCAGVCLLLVLTLIILRYEKPSIFKFIYFLPGILAIMQSGARIYLIPLIVICCVFYLKYIGSISLKIVLIPVVFIVAIYVFLNSGMFNKFIFVNDNQYISSDAIAQLTSGRTEFWGIDILAFFQLSPIYKLMGIGFDYVYQINKQLYGLEIWAHNDIIDCLLSVGILGTIVYMIPVVSVIKSMFKEIRGVVVPGLLLLYIIAPMLLNGFFGYQHFLYSYVLLTVLLIDTERHNINSGDIYEQNRNSYLP